MMEWIGKRSAVVVAAIGLVLVAGCSHPAAQPSQKAAQTAAPKPPLTALAGLTQARSAATSSAPDARLLVAAVENPTAPGADPAWSYTFASPSKGKTYLVVLTGGQSMPSREITGTGYTASELAAVPDTAALKVDSDAAYDKALAASGLKAMPGSYTIGIETYQAKSDTSTVRPFVWRVRFFPGGSGDSTTTVDVNATTGTASLVK